MKAVNIKIKLSLNGWRDQGLNFKDKLTFKNNGFFKLLWNLKFLQQEYNFHYFKLMCFWISSYCADFLQI